MRHNEQEQRSSHPEDKEILFTEHYGIRHKAKSLLTVRISHRRCSVKKIFLQIFQNSQENTCARVSFLIKKHSGTGVFL